MCNQVLIVVLVIKSTVAKNLRDCGDLQRPEVPHFSTYCGETQKVSRCSWPGGNRPLYGGITNNPPDISSNAVKKNAPAAVVQRPSGGIDLFLALGYC